MCCIVAFFFFSQKTAYEMRISDWSSDVCSSDLLRRSPYQERKLARRRTITHALAASVLSIATALAGVPTAAAIEPVDDDRHQVVVQVDDARSAPDVVADAGGEPARTAPLGGSSYASVDLSSAGLAKPGADDRGVHGLPRGPPVGRSDKRRVGKEGVMRV